MTQKPAETQRSIPGWRGALPQTATSPSVPDQKAAQQASLTRINGGTARPAPSTRPRVYNCPDSELLGDWVPQLVHDDYAIIPQYSNSPRARSAPWGQSKSTTRTFK